MRLLIDTNVILDYLLARAEFQSEAVQVISLAAFDDTFEFVSSSAITDVFYHIRKELHDSYAAQEKVRDLMKIITILDVTQRDITRALDFHWKDFEDAVQYAVALSHNVDIIITRNTKDFEGNEIPVMTPGDFLKLIS